MEPVSSSQPPRNSQPPWLLAGVAATVAFGIATVVTLASRTDGTESGSGVREVSVATVSAYQDKSGVSVARERGDAANLALAIDALVKSPILSDSTDAPESPEEQAASDLAGLYEEWNDELASKRFSSDAADRLKEDLEWLRPQMGECEIPAAMTINSARFVISCETGTLEVEVTTDPNDNSKVAGLFFGARGKEPPKLVTELTKRALTLAQTWSDREYIEVFAESFHDDESRTGLRDLLTSIGPCEINVANISSSHGAVFDVSCKEETMRLKVEVDSDDEVILVFMFEL